jgi:hypothetical protein
MYLGPIFIDTKEIFLIIASLFIGAAMFFNWDLTWFHKTDLLTLTILILITKGMLPAIHNEAFLILAIVAIFLTLFLPLFLVVIFYFISFILFRLLRVI